MGELSLDTEQRIKLDGHTIGYLYRLDDAWQATRKSKRSEPARDRVSALKLFAKDHDIESESIVVPGLAELQRARTEKRSAEMIEDVRWLLDGGTSPWEVVKRVGSSGAALEVLFRRAGDARTASKFSPVARDERK